MLVEIPRVNFDSNFSKYNLLYQSLKSSGEDSCGRVYDVKNSPFNSDNNIQYELIHVEKINNIWEKNKIWLNCLAIAHIVGPIVMSVTVTLVVLSVGPAFTFPMVLASILIYSVVHAIIFLTVCYSIDNSAFLQLRADRNKAVEMQKKFNEYAELENGVTLEVARKEWLDEVQTYLSDFGSSLLFQILEDQLQKMDEKNYLETIDIMNLVIGQFIIRVRNFVDGEVLLGKKAEKYQKPLIDSLLRHSKTNLINTVLTP